MRWAIEKLNGRKTMTSIHQKNEMKTPRDLCNNSSSLSWIHLFCRQYSGGIRPSPESINLKNI